MLIDLAHTRLTGSIGGTPDSSESGSWHTGGTPDSSESGS